ncbi:MAG: hypothetical protein K2P51_08085 [Rhabdochlamydiaceae bacterium]|nr:hypothetical protein [Rhabdochlamydiaceae bacterium]
MTSNIGNAPSIPPVFPQGQDTAGLAEQMRTQIIQVAEDFQKLISDPSQLAHPEFVTQVHAHALVLSQSVEKVE